MLFTIIIPTFNHGSTLNFAIRSILAQTISDFELYVIGDGTTDETRTLLKKWQQKDKRIHFIDKPKSARTGEEYRHQLLQSQDSKYVCYLADDDMWFPDHLELMSKALKTHDFVHSFPLYVTPSGEVKTWYGRLDQPIFVRKLVHPKNKRYNFIPLGAAGHTMSLYRRLPHGWRSTPPGKATDLHMWQQIMKLPHLRTTRIDVPTLFHLPSSLRVEASNQQRLKELTYWEKQLQQPSFRTTLMAKLAPHIYNHVLQLQSTKTWQLHDLVENILK